VATNRYANAASKTFDELYRDMPLDPPGYAARVAELEAEGMTTSDAQSVADVEFGCL
jgi:hypothetical protein